MPMLIKKNSLQCPKYIQWLEEELCKDHGLLDMVTTARVQEKGPKEDQQPHMHYQEGFDSNFGVAKEQPPKQPTSL